MRVELNRLTSPWRTLTPRRAVLASLTAGALGALSALGLSQQSAAKSDSCRKKCKNNCTGQSKSKKKCRRKCRHKCN